jgi:hypothetical protein
MHTVKIVLDISLMTYEIPEEWKGALMCPVFKTGDRTDCNNHRGTGLLVAYRDYAKLTIKRLNVITELLLDEE